MNLNCKKKLRYKIVYTTGDEIQSHRIFLKPNSTYEIIVTKVVPE